MHSNRRVIWEFLHVGAAKGWLISCSASRQKVKLNETRPLLAAIAGGRRSCIAFLILSLARRIRARSVVREERYLFPLLQQHIADALGLTPVHVSHVMSSFRARRWMRLCDGTLEITNHSELERLALF